MVKNLLIVSDSFLPRWDGVARFLSEMIPRLTENFRITVIAPDFPGDFETPTTYKLVRLELSRIVINDFPVAKPSRRAVRKHVKEADIVWIHDLSKLGTQGIYAAKKYHKPLVAFNHVIEWEIVFRSLLGPWFFKKFFESYAKIKVKWLYNKCDVLMVPSEDVSFKLEERGITALKVLVPLGVDTKKFHPTENKDQAKLNLDIPADSFVIGYVGRIGREKDLQTLIKAFEYIYKLNRRAMLLIVGSGLIEELPLHDHPNVIFANSQDDVVLYYHAMDVFVLPSLTETTSLVTLEAMACGLPVITTPLSCLKSYIINNENGLFFPKRNSLVLRKKIIHLMNSKKVRDNLSFEARFSVEQRFSWEKTVELARQVLTQF